MVSSRREPNEEEEEEEEEEDIARGQVGARVFEDDALEGEEVEMGVQKVKNLGIEEEEEVEGLLLKLMKRGRVKVFVNEAIVIQFTFVSVNESKKQGRW